MYEGAIPQIEDARHFDLSSCKQLRSVELGIYALEAPLVDNPRPFDAWQNKHVWEPAIRALLTAPPGALSHILLHISLAPAVGSRTSTMFYLPLRTLHWDLLDRVLDRHPKLDVLDIHFAEDVPSFDKARVAVQEELSGRVRSLARFASAPRISRRV